MPRFLWFAPLVVLVVALSIWGFRLGWIAATISETDVIEAWTAEYVASEAGARRSDCAARPGGHEAVWILVTCIHADGRRFDYPVDAFGRLVPEPAPASKPEAPET